MLTWSELVLSSLLLTDWLCSADQSDRFLPGHPTQFLWWLFLGCGNISFQLGNLRTSFDVKSGFSEGLWKYSWLTAMKWRTDHLWSFGDFTCLLYRLCRGPILPCRGPGVHLFPLCIGHWHCLVISILRKPDKFFSSSVYSCFFVSRDGPLQPHSSANGPATWERHEVERSLGLFSLLVCEGRGDSNCLSREPASSQAQKSLDLPVNRGKYSMMVEVRL